MQVRADIAASFQRVALDHLENRVSRAAAWALEDWPGVKHLVVAGGVAANRLLRSKLQVHVSSSHTDLKRDSRIRLVPTEAAAVAIKVTQLPITFTKFYSCCRALP